MQPDELNAFNKCLKFTIKWETGGDMVNGGYTNDPDDPGGETKWGISKLAHPDLDIENLTFEDAAKIYATEYWPVSGANLLPYPGCAAVFDTGVNVGPERAKAWVDWGFPEFDYNAYLSKRVNFYIDRIKKKPAKRKYLAGWMARIGDLKKFIEIESQN